MGSLGIIAVFILLVCIDIPNILKKTTDKGKTISVYCIIILAGLAISILQVTGTAPESPADFIGSFIKGIMGEK